MYVPKKKKEEDDVPEAEPKRDTVADWRFDQCLQAVGLTDAQEFAESGCDLARLRALVDSCCPLPLIKAILL